MQTLHFSWISTRRQHIEKLGLDLNQSKADMYGVVGGSNFLDDKILLGFIQTLVVESLAWKCHHPGTDTQDHIW